MKELRDDFAEEYGKEMLELLFNCIYGYEEDERFDVYDRTFSNAINSSGTVFFYPEGKEGKEITIIYRDGDWNGSEILDYGESVAPLEHKQYRTKFVLDINKLKMKGCTEDQIKLAQMKYNLRKKEIDEMAGKYAYDIYFSPTLKIQQHYRDYMDKNNLMVEYEEVD